MSALPDIISIYLPFLTTQDLTEEGLSQTDVTYPGVAGVTLLIPAHQQGTRMPGVVMWREADPLKGITSLRYD